MTNLPRITFITNTEHLLKSKEIVSDFVSFLKSNGYEYFYPFEGDSTVEEVEKQITQDAEKFHLQDALAKIQSAWETLISNNSITAGHIQYNKNFICVLTMYGPRGFFYTPDKIYVNITFDSEQVWLQTMLHEMLHLVHFEETKKMIHSEREGFIDDKFIELWGDTFPEYSKQMISAKR